MGQVLNTVGGADGGDPAFVKPIITEWMNVLTAATRHGLPAMLETAFHGIASGNIVDGSDRPQRDAEPGHVRYHP